MSSHPDAFPLTRHSVVRALAEPSERAAAFDALARAYWRPVYAYIRLRWHRSPDDARDLTQDFFAQLLEKHYLDKFDPAKARFRTFLRTCLDGFVANAAQHAARVKRGGGQPALSLDFAAMDADLHAHLRSDEPDPEACFRREWIRGLFATALEDLEAHCRAHDRTLAFALFTRYDIEGPDAVPAPTYAALAAELGTTPTTVTNQLFWARREFRAIVVALLQSLCATDEEFQSEAQALLGAVPR